MENRPLWEIQPNMFEAPITQAGLEQLHRYKYVSGGYSPLDNVMNHWWEFVITRVPMSVAPNVLTLMGLLCLISGFYVTFKFAPNPVEHCPDWVLLFCGIMVFCYQTLDAIDGKQARRTKAGSPLGQLFDHGCDSVGTVFMLYFNSVHIIIRVNWIYSVCHTRCELAPLKLNTRSIHGLIYWLGLHAFGFQLLLPEYHVCSDDSVLSCSMGGHFVFMVYQELEDPSSTQSTSPLSLSTSLCSYA